MTKTITKINELINDQVGKNLTEASVDAIRAAFIAHCVETNIDPRDQHGPRQIKSTYRGQDYEITTSSYKQSFQRLLYAFITTVGVDGALIPPLCCESDLIKGALHQQSPSSRA